MAICSEDVVFAPAKIRVDLSWEERVLGDVRVPRVLVQGEKKQPCHTNKDQQCRDVGRQPEYTAVSPQSEDGRSYSMLLDDHFFIQKNKNKQNSLTNSSHELN